MLPLAICLLTLQTAAVYGADNLCFFARSGSGEKASLFVAPKSKVCRSFQRELNANCAGEIPTVEFTPRLDDSGITIPPWTDIPLFTQSGGENSDSFALLEKLTWSRAVIGYSADREARARRDVELLLQQLRDAHSSGNSPRFERAALDLTGSGSPDAVYRVYTGLIRNPTSINEQGSDLKTEPILFLERAIGLASAQSAQPTLASAAGNSIAGMHADVLLFEGTPYFLTWAPNRVVLVYAAYLRRGRQNTHEEHGEFRSMAAPTLRCMFDSKPTH